VLGSRARWFESVPERSNAKDSAPLKVKEVWVKERPGGKCSAKTLLALRKSFNANDPLFQTVEDGS
jgi:hypothetical protein